MSADVYVNGSEPLVCEGGLTALPLSETMEFDAVEASASGVILHMFSNSLNTSDIEGLESVSSWQHLRAKDTNLSMHSEG